MAMTNAERQAAWRVRRDEELQNARSITQRFEKEVERRVAVRLKCIIGRGGARSRPVASRDARDCGSRQA
jgi:hypothetical protein